VLLEGEEATLFAEQQQVTGDCLLLPATLVERKRLPPVVFFLLLTYGAIADPKCCRKNLGNVYGLFSRAKSSKPELSALPCL
jgi:hypothetical protein